MLGQIPPIDPRQIHVLSLSERKSFIQIESAAIDPDSLPPALPDGIHPQLDRLAAAMKNARKCKAKIMLAYGAHLVKAGCGPLLRWLIESNWVDLLATQGAGIIHDWEFAYQGKSSESVRDNAPRGRFGTWDQTGRWINLAAAVGAASGKGLGESIADCVARDGLDIPDITQLRGQIAAEPEHPLTAARADLLRILIESPLPAGLCTLAHPWKRFSVLETASRCTLTVHPGIGYDIIACHPLFQGAAIGRGSQTDFYRFVRCTEDLTHGVYLSIGSAIMSPQVFEKAFSVANNLRLTAGLPAIRDHHVAVIDLQDSGGWDWSLQGEPPPNHPAYYLRWCKSFHRMGGTLDYLQGDLRGILQNLISRLR